jgi:hypothetical protein
VTAGSLISLTDWTQPPRPRLINERITLLVIENFVLFGEKYR